MRHLITGGAGFIGTNYIRYILRMYPDDEIVCADKLTYAGNYDNLKEFEGEKRFAFEQIDICDRKAVYSLFKTYNIDCVVNFAAESHVDRSIENPEIFLQTNIIGTEVLLDAVNKYGIKRFHQISTDEVYGDLPLDRPDLKFEENWSIKTSSPYSASKASADLLCLAYFRTFGTPVTISRCSNNYGPYQFPEKLIPLMIEKAQRDESLPVYGDGKNIRDWLYVEDHCSAVDKIIRYGKVGEIYNIGGNNERANIDIVKIILEALGKPESLITYVKDRPGHDKRYAINSCKIQNELGWKPQTDFDVGMRQTIEWYKNNPKWIERILNGEYRKTRCSL
ncbi:MAG: dTDP-glucose 4,6-dehydratase [Ruminococcaceae bacterium]|nr:dTDP-glucose 4,6-dehydratase [Oscillospiraceae bacterium]